MAEKLTANNIKYVYKGLELTLNKVKTLKSKSNKLLFETLLKLEAVKNQ